MSPGPVHAPSLRWRAIRAQAALALALGTGSACAGRAAGPADPKSLSEQLARNPVDPEANLRSGLVAEQHGDWLRAEQYYLRAEAVGVPADQIVPRIISVLVRAQRYEDALSRCTRRLEQSPGDIATRHVQAALLVTLRRPTEAEAALGDLLRAAPADPDAHLLLGRIYRDGGDRERARAMLQRYLELAPRGEHAASVRFELAALSADPEPASATVAPAVTAPASGTPAADTREVAP